MRYVLGLLILFTGLTGMLSAKNVALEPEIKDVDSSTVLVLPMKGPYDQHEEAIKRVTEYMNKNKVTITGPMIGIYYDNPELVKPEELNWEIGFFVSSDTKAEEPFVVKVLPRGKVASLICVGPYDGTASCYPKLLGFIKEKGVIPAGPVREIFLTTPKEEIKPEEYKTEIQIPVVKEK